jgi:phospholipid/cholesterol/gamma-HCH transport system substrate-binding protein
MSEFYKDQRKIELRVGLIAILCLVILVLGYAWLRNALQLKSMTEVKVKFANAQGIELGDKVTVNGMEAGRIRKITQMEDGILISSLLRLKYPLRQGARYTIQDSNLMGGKQMNIENPASGEPLDPKQIQTGDASFGMTALFDTAAMTMQQINKLLAEINQPDGLAAQVKATLNESKTTFSKVNSTIDENRVDLKQAMQQISASATQLNELLTQNKPGLDKVIGLTPELLQKAQVALDSLQTATSSLQKAVYDITQGKGTLPSLINDDTLYQNLLKSTSRLDSLLLDIKKNPKRYFRVKVF